MISRFKLLSNVDLFLGITELKPTKREHPHSIANRHSLTQSLNFIVSFLDDHLLLPLFYLCIIDLYCLLCSRRRDITYRNCIVVCEKVFYFLPGQVFRVVATIRIAAANSFLSLLLITTNIHSSILSHSNIHQFKNMTDSLEEFDFTAAAYYNNSSGSNSRPAAVAPSSSSSAGLTSPQSNNNGNSLYNLPHNTFSPPSSSGNTATTTSSSGIIHGNASVYRSRYASNSLDYSDRDYNADSTPITLGSSNAEVDQSDDGDSSEEEVFQLINISIYDAMTPSSTILRVNRRIYAKEICRAIGNKLELSKEEAQYHTLVLVVTTYDHEKRMNVHCVRTFQNEESVLNIVDSLLAKLIDKYQVVDVTKLRNSVRWYYKDVRTTPIEFGDNEEATGEYSSDEEEEVSHSDLAYLAKAERKGYLLKRSGRDQNLWRKWYCVLTDHLWCIDIHRTVPKAICIRLSGMIRSSHLHNKTASSYNSRRMISRDISPAMAYNSSTSGKERFRSESVGGNADGNQSSSFSSEEQLLHNIVINSTRGTHLLRAFNLQDQKKWIEELHLKTTFALENDYFNMAEVIVCDEEVTKSRRFHRPITSLLSIPMFFDSLLQDQRKLQYTTVSIPMEDVDMDEAAESGFVSANSDTRSSKQTEDMSSLSPPSSLSLSPNRSIGSKVSSTGNSIASSIPNSPFTPKSSSITAANLDNSQPPSVLTTTKVHFSTIHPLDRTLQTSSIHRIYGHDALFTHVLRLFLDILEYKELFRHDLFITSSYQRQVAVFIFLKYLLPILQIQDAQQNPDDRALNGKLIAHAVKSMSFKALLMNYDENELLAYLSLAQASAISSPPQQQQKNNNNSKKLTVDTSISAPSSSASSTLKPLLRPEDANSSYINTESTQGIPKSRLDMLWELSNSRLFKVYSALFESEVTSGKSPNGTSSADRLKAGTGQSSNDQNKQPSNANNNANSSSFWSWGWSSSNTPTSGNNGGNMKQGGSSGVSPSSKGNDPSSEEFVATMVNFPTQDLFDGILDEVQAILMNQ